MKPALPSLDGRVCGSFIFIFRCGLFQLNAVTLAVGNGGTEPLTQARELRENASVMRSQEYIIGISRGNGSRPVTRLKELRLAR